MLTRAHAAQGSVTLEPEQGELGANFCYLGKGYGTFVFLPPFHFTSWPDQQMLRVEPLAVSVPAFRDF
jgi:hypothetical protein